MNLIISIFYITLFSALLYLYLITFKWFWRLIVYIRIKYKIFWNRRDNKASIYINKKEHFGVFWKLFKNRKKNIAVLCILFILSMTIFVQNLFKYATSENKNIQAKYYFAVGQTANTFKMVSLNLFHPDFPLLLPIKWFQKLVYLHGTSLLPKNDNENYLWKQLWFYNPYTITLTPPWDMKGRHETPIYNNRHFSKMYNGFVDALRKIMDGNISDRKLFYEVMPRDISSDLEFAAVFQMYEDGLRYTGKAGIHIAQDEKYQKQTADFYRYSKIAQKWWEKKIVPKQIRDIKTQRLTFLEAKLIISDNRLFEQLMEHTTTCNNPAIDEYFQDRINLYNELTPQYKRRFFRMLRTYTSMFYNYLFVKYCNKKFPVPPNRGGYKNISRWEGIDRQETNLRVGIGYDLQTQENNITLKSLFEALKDRNTSKVLQELQEKNLSADVRFFGDKTPMHYAAHYNDIKTMEALLKLGASIDLQDKATKIPLQYAIESYNYEATKFLLEHNSSHRWVPENIGIDNIPSFGNFDVAPWEYIIHHSHYLNDIKKEVRFIKLLIRHNVNLFEELEYCKGTNFLNLVVHTSSFSLGGDTTYKNELVKMLLKKGLDFRKKNCGKISSYQYAVGRYPWMHKVFEPYMTKEERQYYKIKLGGKNGNN